MMKFWARLLVHTLTPPFVGSCAVWIGTIWVSDYPTVGRALQQGAGLVLLGYIFAAIPSLLYAFMMEVWYWLGGRFGCAAAIWFSGLLGMAWGGLPWLLGGGVDAVSITMRFALSGLAAGIATEVLVQSAGRRAPTSSGIGADRR